jgi:TPP-dependent pyruvate/acetoin dehydrogenase alpha subunit
LLVTESYRLEGHYAGEPEVYRSRAEVEEHRRLEPIGRFRKYLITEERAGQAELDAVDAEIRQEIADAVRFAKESPEPVPATAMDYIYA